MRMPHSWTNAYAAAERLGPVIMEDMQKTQLFENIPVPKAVMKLAVPTIISSSELCSLYIL